MRDLYFTGLAGVELGGTGDGLVEVVQDPAGFFFKEYSSLRESYRAFPSVKKQGAYFVFQ